MVKNKIGEKTCRDCGEQIIGRRADAIICKDCRREAQARSSQKIKEQEKEERIWRKAEESGVKIRIEYRKVQEILRKLKNGHLEDEDEPRGTWLQISGLRENSISPYAFGIYGLIEGIEIVEMKPFWEFIEKKIQERLGREIIKIKIEHKNKMFL
jgi:hypothetical protein